MKARGSNITRKPRAQEDQVFVSLREALRSQGTAKRLCTISLRRLGFRGLGFRGLAFRGLGFRV